MTEPKRIKGDTIKTPRGSHIRSLYPDSLDLTGPPKAQIENFKRRLQYKGGVRSNVLNTDGYKDFHRQEKLNHFREDQRSKRDAALSKSRGLSLPALSKTRKTVTTAPAKEGETPTVVFVPRHNLRPRRQQPSTLDDTVLTMAERIKRGTIEKRMSQYKRRKSESLNFVNWHERDEEWRKKRIENYMSTSKTAREAALLKKRKLTICGWGNPQKNLGNYLSICWDYNPDLDADKTQKLPDMTSVILNRHDDRGFCTDSGLIYYPDIINKSEMLNGYCFTVQSELALNYEIAQKILFEQASNLVQRVFWQYNMDLTLDTSLDDGFTVDMFVSSAPESDVGKITVRGVTQFIFMKSYIYVDKICVAPEHQKSGLGKFMMDRIIAWAEQRDKDILLYALGPVVKVYEKWGFTYCKEWPAIQDDIGAIMRKRVKTAGVVDDFVGLQWDGTKFA
ncbi:hypothetical protein BGZ59_004471 [Podila verticillata]|nr:hypothetical protein BGZ59_004471 [Podila verticillata]KAI9232255.1 MAG: hypothetical protein BYD32DRAFT_466423 [Podila humilis]